MAKRTIYSSSVQYLEAATPKIIPLKKSKAKESRIEKLSEICNFNKRGYCKSKENCTKKHSDIVCDDLECDEEKCFNKLGLNWAKLSPSWDWTLL